MPLSLSFSNISFLSFIFVFDLCSECTRCLWLWPWYLYQVLQSALVSGPLNRHPATFSTSMLIYTSMYFWHHRLATMHLDGHSSACSELWAVATCRSSALASLTTSGRVLLMLAPESMADRKSITGYYLSDRSISPPTPPGVSPSVAYLIAPICMGSMSLLSCQCFQTPSAPWCFLACGLPGLCVVIADGSPSPWRWSWTQLKQTAVLWWPGTAVAQSFRPEILFVLKPPTLKVLTAFWPKKFFL